MRIPLLLELVADALPNRLVVAGAGGSLTYLELQRASSNAAAQIARMSVDNVGFLGTNSPAFPIAMFASAIAGRPFSPLNYRLPDEDLHKLITRLSPALLIIDEEMTTRVGHAEGIATMTRDQFLEAAKTPEPEDWIAPEANSEVAVLLFTSGTSGEPKAAMLKHQNLTSYVLQMVEFLGAEEGEAALVSVPPYHIAAVSAVLTSIYCGRTMIQLGAFTPEDWVASARRFSVTHAMLVPTMLGRVLDVIESHGIRLPSLKALAYGGGRMPVSAIRRALELLPDVAFTNAYGLTETSSTISLLGPDDHRMAQSGEEAALRRLASVGRPVPGISVDIRGPDATSFAIGQAGEIWVRGDQVSGEYVGRKVIDEQGWFPTKDLGWLDEQGYLFIDGRLDDVIVRGGENISPGEIEDTLRLHPAIADVAVVGAPDDEWGEKIVAFAVLRDAASATAEELRDWVRTRLRSTKAPKDILFRSELPYNETGKLLRRLLRDELTRTGAAKTVA